jgi:hypothetical protein
MSVCSVEEKAQVHPLFSTKREPEIIYVSLPNLANLSLWSIEDLEK